MTVSRSDSPDWTSSAVPVVLPPVVPAVLPAVVASVAPVATESALVSPVGVVPTASGATVGAESAAPSSSSSEQALTNIANAAIGANVRIRVRRMSPLRP